MYLEVDNREPIDIKNLLSEKIDKIEFKNLDIGDYIFRNELGEIEYVFERKSLSDLESSIKDGRYLEQSFRLLESNIDPRNIFYIIEGNLNQYCNRKSENIKKMLYSAIFSLATNKGFSIMKTLNNVETVDLLYYFFLKAQKMTSEKSIGSKEYTDVIKISKKANITKNNINEIMLCQIPGISNISARAIIFKVSTIENLIKNIRDDPDYLSDIIVKNNSSTRKLSKKVIQSIKDFLLD